MPTENLIGSLVAIFWLLLTPLIFLSPILILLIGWAIGRRREQAHLVELDRREAAMAGVLVSSLGSLPGLTAAAEPRLVVAEVVIASDAMKSWLSGWQNLFGGEMKSYVALQSRARREVRLRLIEQAVAAGCNAVGNIRLEGVDIMGAALAGRGNRKAAAAVALVASGTAYTFSPVAD
ncbi:MAG: YbjQ family protein [Lentisphaerae bacterium]|nr:YbjQ family protein [Lentisphaerota bacterium]